MEGWIQHTFIFQELRIERLETMVIALWKRLKLTGTHLKVMKCISLWTTVSQESRGSRHWLCPNIPEGLDPPQQRWWLYRWGRLWGRAGGRERVVSTRLSDSAGNTHVYCLLGVTMVFVLFLLWCLKCAGSTFHGVLPALTFMRLFWDLSFLHHLKQTVPSFFYV